MQNPWRSSTSRAWLFLGIGVAKSRFMLLAFRKQPFTREIIYELRSLFGNNK
jgi:arginine/ornithine N-succinyltransferase beta subunit